MQKYKIEELIGEGSFGSVYLVRNDKGDRFAYKKIQIDPFHAEEAQREIEIMRKFNHPNLVRIYQHHFEEDKELLHIIMEYCQGGDLAHFAQQNLNLPPADVFEILRQLVSAFVVISANGVIHRDLKPENILLSKDKTVKIADFGCAKCVGVNHVSVIQNWSEEKGTFLYASAEQLRMEKYSFKCDVWAAGCIAFLLQYGYHPFAEANPHNVLALITEKTHNTAISLQAKTSQTLATFISMALIYEDMERASWRQLQLCRLFSPKITNIEKYIEYLKGLSPMANQMVKQFWKIHKSFKFVHEQDKILIYYLIKFQRNNLKMCLKLLKKAKSYRYLFDQQVFQHYAPNELTFNQIKKSYLEYDQYYQSIKKSMQQHQSYATYILPYEPQRSSPFIDLDKSIRIGYKILLHVKNQLAASPFKDSRIWLWLAKWINFEKWYAFEREPVLDMFIESSGDVMGRIEAELAFYEKGMQ